MSDRGGIASRTDEVRLAVMLLTRLPAGRIEGEAPAMARSAWAWPLAGLVVGLVSAMSLELAGLIGLPGLPAALIAIAVAALATGAMHEDGLADLADGFGGGGDRERKLEIMRDSRIGSYGVVALVLSLGFRAAGIAALAASGSAFWAIVGLAAASRAVLPAMMAVLPPARGDGLGHSAGAGEANHVVALAIGLVCLLPLGLGAALTAALAIAAATALLGALAMRQIGGQTGDVLGAGQQVAEIAGLAAILALA